jgi:hypothetical protein
MAFKQNSFSGFKQTEDRKYDKPAPTLPKGFYKAVDENYTNKVGGTVNMQTSKQESIKAGKPTLVYGSASEDTPLNQMSAPPREPSIESLSPQKSASKPSLPPKIVDYHNHMETKIMETLPGPEPIKYERRKLSANVGEFEMPLEGKEQVKHYTGGVRRANTPQVDPYLNLVRLGKNKN